MVALVELLLGKGHQVSIYDQDVSLARLHGSNRIYIDQTIPHISCLMKESIESAIDDSEVVVVASGLLSLRNPSGAWTTTELSSTL